MPEHRSFADDVRGRSSEQLVALLRARPDLAEPPPNDLSVLAARAASRSSVHRALEALTADRLQVLGAFLAGVELPDDAATSAVADDLWTRGLLWHSPSGLSAVRAAGEIIAAPGRAAGPSTASNAEGALRPPLPTGTVRPADDVDHVAGLAAIALIRHVEDLGALWSRDAPPVLRKGGLGVREQRALTGQLGLDSMESVFVTEMACAAGLFAKDGQIEPHWRPTERFDDWLEGDPSERWALLANTWWLTLRAPCLVGTRTSSGVVNLLGPDANWPLMHTRRHDVLGVLAEVEGVPTEAELDALLHWQRPLRLQSGAPTRAGDVLREAGWLGLSVGTQVTPAGRALVGAALSGRDLAPLIPALADQVFVQADLTAITPGPLTDDLHRLINGAADIESRGGATVFRFSDRSVSHALDSGWSAQELRAMLQEASPTPLPQPLIYLIDDAARRHGRTLVGSASAYVRSDEEGTLAALVADSELATLGLRLIAPTVAVAAVPAGRLIAALRRAGHGALAESAEGLAVALPGETYRAPTPAELIRRDPVSPSPEQLARIVASAQSQNVDGLRANRRDDDPSVLLGILQDAVADHLPVWIGYVDDRGRMTRTLVHPKQVVGGRVLGMVAGYQRAFQLYRIRDVSSV